MSEILPSAEDLDRVAAEETARLATAKGWLCDDLVYDYEKNERRFELLDRRLRIVEKRGSLLPDLNEENIFFYLTVAYVLFGFVLPGLLRMFGGESGGE